MAKAISSGPIRRRGDRSLRQVGDRRMILRKDTTEI